MILLRRAVKDKLPSGRPTARITRETPANPDASLRGELKHNALLTDASRVSTFKFEFISSFIMAPDNFFTENLCGFMLVICNNNIQAVLKVQRSMLDYLLCRQTIS